MKSAAFIMVLILAVTGGPARAQLPRNPQTADGHYPGPLETFLKNAKAPTLETKIFGSFEGEQNAKVIFKAIIARDRTAPARKLRGLAIELTSRTCRHTAYVDVDVSKPDDDWLKESLSQLQYIEDRRSIQEDRRAKDLDDVGTFVSVLNGVPPSEMALAKTVLTIGWWTAKKSDPVLAINWIPCGMPLFPKATVTDVMNAISAAHDYLWSH